jgi:hypothetical protein
MVEDADQHPILILWAAWGSNPEPRILGWLFLASCDYLRFRNCKRSSSVVVWCCLALFSDRKVSKRSWSPHVDRQHCADAL